MIFYHAYTTEFMQKHTGATFRCELWCSRLITSQVRNIHCSASPLTIEWESSEIDGTVQGSTATLELETPGDRILFTDLGNPDDIWMLRVYRNDVRYWTGCLDMEGIEEPYSQLTGYDVQLTFTDFGVLNRTDFSLHGIQLVDDIMKKAIGDVANLYQGGPTTTPYNFDTPLEVDSTYISMAVSEYLEPTGLQWRSANPSNLKVNCENFYDEDGKPKKWREVLEAILKPLGYRMVQRGTKLFLYDINALIKRGPGARTDWSSTDSKLGNAPIYNKVTVTYSPYMVADGLLPETTYKGKTSKTAQPFYEDRLASAYTEALEDEKGGGAGFSVMKNANDIWLKDGKPDYGAIEFNCFLGGGLTGGVVNPDGYETFNPDSPDYNPGDMKCRSAMFVPINGGGEETPAIIYDPTIHDSTVAERNVPNFRPQREEWHHSGGTPFSPWHKIYDNYDGGDVNQNDSWLNPGTPKPIFKTRKIYLPPMSEEDAATLFIRIQQPILVDTRYNPFNEECEYNEWDTTAAFDCETNSHVRWVFLQTRVRLYGDEAGEFVKANYDNNDVASGGEVGNMSCVKGSWKTGTGKTYLQYYSPDDPEAWKIGNGWKTNRQCIGRPDNLGVRNTTLLGDHIDKNVADGVIEGREYFFYEEFKKMDDGEYIPYPAQGGWLEYAVMNCIQAHVKGDAVYGWTGTSGRELSPSLNINKWNLCQSCMYAVLRWIAFQPPRIDLINSYAPYDVAAQDDIEYTGELIKRATEELKIETIVGCARDASPLCRGIIYLHDFDEGIDVAVKSAKCDDRESELAKLLLGRYISNLAQPRKQLSGEVSNQYRVAAQVAKWSDANDDGATYIITHETDNCLECTSSIELTQAFEDTYYA